MKQPEGLISVLLDEGLPFGDRHDAAMDLEEYKTLASEKALLQVVLDGSSDTGLADACKDSLSQVMPQEFAFKIHWENDIKEFTTLNFSELNSRLKQLSEN